MLPCLELCILELNPAPSPFLYLPFTSLARHRHLSWIRITAAETLSRSLSHLEVWLHLPSDSTAPPHASKASGIFPTQFLLRSILSNQPSDPLGPLGGIAPLTSQTL